jgi:hypothetical protein
MSRRCKTHLSGVAIFVASWLITTRALALPLSYSEAASGDLTFPSPAFTLDAGSNTISGTTHFSVNEPGRPRLDTDFDSFAFIVPTGLQVAGISLSFVTTAVNVSRANLELRLCRDSSTCGLDPMELLGVDEADLLGVSPHSVDFGLRFPLLAGTYSLVTSGIGIGIADVGIPQAAWFADYAWTLAVRSVREPSVLWLFALGLAGLLTIRRGARTAAS